jgi:hypothetical protein
VRKKGKSKVENPGWRILGEYGTLTLGMAHRPDPSEFDTPLTKEEVDKRRRDLSMLSEHHVRDAYREAYERCRMEGDAVPRARAVQELVTVWKLLWSWRRRRTS